MESNTDTMVVNKNSKSQSENISKNFGIENCSDDTENVEVVEQLSLKTKTNKAADEEVIVKEFEVESGGEEVASDGDVVDTEAAAAEEDNEKSEKSVEIIGTTFPATPTTTNVVINAQTVEEPQAEMFEKEENVKEQESVKTEIEERAGGIELDDKVTVKVAVGSKETEVKVNNHVISAIGSSVVQPQQSQDQVDMEHLKQQEARQVKTENWNSNTSNIISDIDSSIEKENIALLKQQQKELLEKQKELAQQIRHQQLIHQQLAEENLIQKQQLKEHKQQQQQFSLTQTQPQQETHKIPTIFSYQQTLSPYQPQENLSKLSTVEETKDEYGDTRKTETFESKESTDITKKVDLQKIFTPATDTEQILPRNRKIYASSAFYSPALHPTVEDQVELARRISHSLSDISNQKSKGQTMYVNRKKRSVKWVHEGAGQDCSVQEGLKKNTAALSTNQNSPYNQVPLRLLMNPRGKVRDITTAFDPFNTKTGLLSPDKCAELVTALQAQKDKGAELFAKRRRKSEKWVLDETNTGTQSPSGLPDYHQPQQQQVRPPTSPNILPAYSDAGKHRVLLNLEQEQLLEKYTKPGVKVVKTPWEAALETGFASTAFIEDGKLNSQLIPPPLVTTVQVVQNQYAATAVPEPASSNDGYATDSNIESSHTLPYAPFLANKPCFNGNPQRDLAYKPSLPQGWRALGVTLPTESEQLIRDVNRNCNTYVESKENYDQEIIDYFESAEITKQMNEITDASDRRIQQAQKKLKQLQIFENHHRELMEEQTEEAKRLRQRVKRIQKLDQQLKLMKQQQKNQEPPVEKKDEQHTQMEERNEYVKVAVHELIYDYEQQLVNVEQRDSQSLSTLNVQSQKQNTDVCLEDIKRNLQNKAEGKKMFV